VLTQASSPPLCAGTGPDAGPTDQDTLVFKLAKKGTGAVVPLGKAGLVTEVDGEDDVASKRYMNVRAGMAGRCARDSFSWQRLLHPVPRTVSRAGVQRRHQVDTARRPGGLAAI